MRARSLFTLALLISTAALAEETSDLSQAMQIGDTRMTCDALIQEASNLETRLGGAPASGIDGEALVNVGAGLAAQAAARAGATRALGAVGAIGGQVGGMFGRSRKQREQREAQQREIATQRWYYVVGLYQGRRCDDLPAAPNESAPVTAPEVDTPEPNEAGTAPAAR